VNAAAFVRCVGIDEKRGDSDDGDRETERLADPRRKVVDPMSHPSPDVEDLSLGPHLDRPKEGLSKFVR